MVLRLYCLWLFLSGIVALASPSSMSIIYTDRCRAETRDFLGVYRYTATPQEPPATTGLDAPARYRIVSPDDPTYRGAGCPPLTCSIRQRVVRVARRDNAALVETALFLRVPTPLQVGCHYQVRNALTETGTAIYDPRQITPSLRVNQLGYLPTSPHRAYFGLYLGTLGGLPCPAKRFHLLDDAGQTVFTGPIAVQSDNDGLIGQDVAVLDFSAFTRLGRYRIALPDVGVSSPFIISNGVLMPLYHTLLLGNLHQRCGMALTEPYTRFPRPACHTDDAWCEETVIKTNLVASVRDALYPTCYDGHRLATRGHHDAGDYGKYTVSGAAYVNALLTAWDAFPDLGNSDALGLPDSGNGIPDLVDECKWELDWLENMQDADGGVFSLIRPPHGGYDHNMPPVIGKRCFFPKETTATAAYAAALAHASRAPLIRRYYPDAAVRYLDRARRAWGFLSANHRDVRVFHYGQLFGDGDERVWAAVELYAATGEQPYHAIVLRDLDPDTTQWGWRRLPESIADATYGYLFLTDRPRDPALLARCRAAVLATGDQLCADADRTPYRLPLPRAIVTSRRFGWVFPGAEYGYPLLLCYALTGDDRYRTTALDCLHYALGANPHGYTLYTGLGAQRGSQPVSDVSDADGIPEPVPGIPLGIGSDSIYRFGSLRDALSAPSTPADWPLLLRWYDGFNVYSECTSAQLARETAVAAFFAAPSIPATVTDGNDR